MPNKKKKNEWEKKLRDSTKIRLLGLLMIVYALQLINDEKGIDSAVENFIKGNKALVKTLLPKDRVELWEKCEKDSWNPVRTTAMDWKLSLILLEKELESYAH